MINVRYTKRDGQLKLTLSGHADKGERAPFVCSAVSALTDTLGIFLTKNYENADADLKNGYARICAIQGEEYFDLVFFGLCLIAAQFPENVSVEKL